MMECLSPESISGGIDGSDTCHLRIEGWHRHHILGYEVIRKQILLLISHPDGDLLPSRLVDGMVYIDLLVSFR